METQPLLILPDWLITTALEKPKHLWGFRIVGNLITHVKPHAELLVSFPNEKKLMAPGQLLAPGFVNAHTHMYGILAHGIPLHKAPAGFWPFLTDFWWPLVEDRLDHQMICSATALRCVHLLQTGVTSFYDCTEAPNALPGCLEAQALVVKRSGLRGILSFEATERVNYQNGQLGLQENTRFVQDCQKILTQNPDYLISGMMCHHTLFTCSGEFIKQSYSRAQELNVLLHAHVSEGTYEPEFAQRQFGKRPMQVYHDLGVAGSGFLASQCVQINPDEIDLISQLGIRTTHMPLSNCEVGGGIAPVPEMVDGKTYPGLGSDGYIEDFFEIMRGAFLIHKANCQDPRVMPASIVWYMATEGGARSLGLSSVGRIEAGWKADLQLIDAQLPTPLEARNLYEQMLLYRNSTHVRAVFVDGKLRVEAGIVLNTDQVQLMAQAKEQAARLWVHAE